MRAARPCLLALVLAAGGCRQVLGIPGEGTFDDGDERPLFPVSVVATGVDGASAAVGLDVTRTDGASDHVDLTGDGMRMIELPDGVGYAIKPTPPPSVCTIENATGTVMGGPPSAASLVCDGVAALVDPGFTAPVLPSFSSSADTHTLVGSFLVQEIQLTPRTKEVAATVTVALDGLVQTATAGTWGPFAFTAGSTIEITSSYAPFVRPYTFTISDADAEPAAFGYGKPATPLVGSRFGSAVAADGTLLVVGAPGPADASAPGHAYVFRRTGTHWVEQAVLQAPVPANGDHFGASVALRDQLIVIGAPRIGTTAGTAYLFLPTVDDGWSAIEMVPPPGDGLGFGSAIALDGSNIYVGAPRTSSAAGAVYQYDIDGTNPQTFAAGTDAGDQLGASIAVQGGTVVIGAPGEASSTSLSTDNGYPGAGAAYVYTGGLGSSPTYLKATSPAPGDAFGTAVATNGTLVVVGAPNQDSSAPLSTGIDPPGLVSGGAPQSGAAYMWRHDVSTWTFTHTLKAPNTGSGDGFGSALAFVRNVLAIGAPFEDSGALELSSADESRPDAGAVYAYRITIDADVTQMPAYIKAATPGVDDAFGSALGLSLASLVVGAPYDSSGATGWNGQGGDYDADAGAVTTFR